MSDDRSLHALIQKSSQALTEHEERAVEANEEKNEESTDLDTDTNGHSPRQ